MFTSDSGDMEPALGPYSGSASHAAMGKFIKLAWDKGIRIVAGTDNVAGLSLPRELELYVKAGIPAAEVLAIATIGAARVMGKDKESGSIAVGKKADLVLLDGDSTKDIGAVRKADVVVCRGLVYDPARLFAAIGMKGR